MLTSQDMQMDFFLSRTESLLTDVEAEVQAKEISDAGYTRMQ